ncbi:MAG: site-2 protease family protein, partial [Desulfomonilia bacterium]
IWVSLAGPASNLVLAVICAVVFRMFGSALATSFLYPLAYMIQIMIMINVGLAIFNLIPIPPLDGSHIVEGLLPIELAAEYQKIQPYGFIILLVLIFTGVVDFLIIPIIRSIVNLLLTL